MVRYYGYYSNVTRGKRRERAEDYAIPYIIESDRFPAACRKRWARLIQKIEDKHCFFIVGAGGGFGKELISCWKTGRKSNPSAADGNG